MMDIDKETRKTWEKLYGHRRKEKVGVKQGLLNIAGGVACGALASLDENLINPYLLIPAIGNPITSGIKRIRKMDDKGEEGIDFVIGALGGGILNDLLFVVPYAITYSLLK